MFEITVVKFKSNPDSVYCGRGSTFGNPYPITQKDNRDVVCDKFDVYFYEQVNSNPKFTNELKRIYQKGLNDGYLKLGCFCAPQRCHCNTIKRFLEDNGDSFFNHE